MRFWLLALCVLLSLSTPVSGQQLDEFGFSKLVDVTQERRLVGYFYVVKTISIDEVVPGMQKVFARREFKGGKSGGGLTEVAYAPSSEKFVPGEQVEFITVSYALAFSDEMSAPARFARKKKLANSH